MDKKRRNSVKILCGIICIWFVLCSGFAFFNGFYLLTGGQYYGGRSTESFFIAGVIYGGIAFLSYLGRKHYEKKSQKILINEEEK